MKTQIVDTNVILVANGAHPDVSPKCVSDCAVALYAIKRQGRVAIDDAFEILREYMNNTNAVRGKGVGDAFVKWLLQVKPNPLRCDQIALQPHATKGFERFPDDPELAHFDPSDRKFIALACAHPKHPPILEATDSKWLDWAPALNRHAVEVVFVCEDDIRRFQQRKAQKKQG